MRNHYSSGFRSVGTGFTVVLAAILAWTFDLYTPYFHSNTSESAGASQTLSSMA